MLVILIKQNYDLFKEGKSANDFKYLSKYQVMRAVIAGTNGGKDREKASYIKEKYKEHKLMLDLMEVGRKLKIHNLAMVISRIKSNFKSFFTKIKKRNTTAKPPKPKKLAKVTRFTIPLDVNAFSLKKENQLGINLSDQMFYLSLNHQRLKEIVGDLKNIQAIQVHLSNGEIYLKVSYRYKMQKAESSGVESQEVRELKERLANWKQQLKEHPDLAHDGEVAQLIIKTEETLERALARSSVETHHEEQIKEAGLDVGIENLASIFIADQKAKSLIVSGKRFKHYNAKFNRFIAKLAATISDLQNSIKEMKDIDKEKRLALLIKFRSFLYEKRNRYFHDQFHKISSGDVVQIQNLARQNKPIVTNDFQGSRVKRGLFKDSVLGKIFNADLNAALNIIKIGTLKSFDWLKDFLFKFCNPIKLISDWELICFLRVNTIVG